MNLNGTKMLYENGNLKIELSDGKTMNYEIEADNLTDLFSLAECHAKLNESNQKKDDRLTIADFAKKLYAGQMDMDVADTEIDMMVAFCYDFNEEPTDTYDRFLEYLGKHTKIERHDNLKVGDWLVCDFSGLLKPYNDKLKELNKTQHWGTIEFDGDETYYDYVLWLEGLISGNESEKTYERILSVLESE